MQTYAYGLRWKRTSGDRLFTRLPIPTMVARDSVGDSGDPARREIRWRFAAGVNPATAAEATGESGLLGAAELIGAAKRSGALVLPRRKAEGRTS